jgi:NAD(P)-dependent dehydrogenase (short-subunit alcohol dehydrogenase family)
MKIALITGASRGIGKNTAMQLAKRGVGVIVTYNGYREGAEAVVRDIEQAGGQAVALQLDVGVASSFPAFVATVAQALKEKWQRDSFDYLVNNAGVGAFKLIKDVTEQDFDLMMNIHLKGPFFLTQQLLPLMADGGSIVNLTSATTRVAFAGVAPYAAMKGGLDVLTRYMAKEFGDRKIRANAVSPGAIRTDLGGNPLDNNPEFAELLAGQAALGRVGEPEDVGMVIASLLSGDCQWVNAQTVEVSGGYFI